MEIKDWKAYLAGKVASALVFIPSLFYTIADSIFHLDDIIIHSEPEGLNIVRDLLLVTLSGVSYIACNDLYHKALNESKSQKFQISKLEDTAEDVEEVGAEDARHYFELGKEANKNNKHISAEKYFNTATELAPENAHYLYALAASQFNLKKYDSAKLNISKAIDIDDQKPDYYLLTEKIYRQLGNDTAANKAHALAEESRE